MEMIYKTQKQVIENRPKKNKKAVGQKITVPDMGYSIREILQKFSSGSVLSIGKDMKYNDELIVSRNIDPTELNDVITRTKARLMEEKRQKLLEQKKRDDEQFQKKLSEAMEKELAKVRETTKP